MKTASVVIGVILCGLCLAQSVTEDVNHPRRSEAIETATAWLDLLESGKSRESFERLTEIFKSNLTEEGWKESIDEDRVTLGKLKTRELKRAVIYGDPENAPLPGTYAAVEFDSVYEHARKHFQYVILHSFDTEPFKIMRRESKQLINRSSPRSSSAR